MIIRKKEKKIFKKKLIQLMRRICRRCDVAEVSKETIKS